ncbi:hypothetical protein RRG08_055347 [Elysia crispata]|uniref:Uncharacterized protein n=1 Tax=Elysia crispata TaxID=231223 RepID=A0AAE1AQB7_9GAST|nr:hypothetical protein RRG08_055347 [Elysia crispata]
MGDEAPRLADSCATWRESAFCAQRSPSEDNNNQTGAKNRDKEGKGEHGGVLCCPVGSVSAWRESCCPTAQLSLDMSSWVGVTLPSSARSAVTI